MASPTLSIRLLAEPVRSLAAGVITSTYMGIGTELDFPSRIPFIQNLTNQTLMFSLDGIDDHFPLPANGYMILDVVANKSQTQGMYISEGQRFYVKDMGTPATTGAVYVTTFYGSNSL